jgi:hypothetical protein
MQDHEMAHTLMHQSRAARTGALKAKHCQCPARFPYIGSTKRFTSSGQLVTLQK